MKPDGAAQYVEPPLRPRRSASRHPLGWPLVSAGQAIRDIRLHSLSPPLPHDAADTACGQLFGRWCMAMAFRAGRVAEIVGAYLGVSYRSILRWRDLGRLPAPIWSVLAEAEDHERWLAAWAAEQRERLEADIEVRRAAIREMAGVARGVMTRLGPTRDQWRAQTRVTMVRRRRLQEESAASGEETEARG